MDTLLNSWTGEFGLFVTVNRAKFRAGNAEKTELGKPGILLILGVKDNKLEQLLGQQLKELQEPEQMADVSSKKVPIRVYEKIIGLPDEISRLDLIPSICQAGNYLVLSVAFNDEAGVSALNRYASRTPAVGLMAGSKNWAELSSQSSSSISVPKANLALFLSPAFGDELAKWQKLDLWQNIDPGLQKTLVSLAGSKQDGGMLAFTHVLPNGVVFKSYVNGDSSDGSFQRVKEATHAFLAALVPQLATLAYEHWSKLEVPPMPKLKPVPQPETPEKPGS